MTYSEAMQNTKRAALRDGYSNILYIDGAGEYSISRVYKGCIKKWDFKKLLLRVNPVYKSGVLNIEYKFYNKGV